MTKRTWPQYFVTFMCNVSILSFGMQAGWLSPLQPALQSTASPLGAAAAPLSNEEVSWIGSLPSLSLVAGAPIYGYWMDRYGRKITCFLATAPNIITYLLLIFADNVWVVYAARLLGGLCSSGAFIVAPIYTNEVSEQHLRGFLGSLTGSFIKLGIIFSFVVGGYFSYFVLNMFSMSFTVIFVVFYYWLPESPSYLLGKNDERGARSALEALRGGTSKDLDDELSCFESDIMASKSDGTEKFTLKKLFTNKANLKALFITNGIFSVQMLSGYPAIMRYTVDIFQDSGVSYSPYVAAILVAVAQLVAALVGASVLEKVGRKLLVQLCTGLMALAMALISISIFVRDLEWAAGSVQWLKFMPTVALILYVIGYATGYGSVPFIIIPELFAPEARASASSFSNLWTSILEFIVIKLFLSIADLFGLSWTFAILFTHCCIGMVFIRFVMFETKGLTFAEIYQKLSGRKEERPQALQPFFTKHGNEKTHSDTVL